MRDVFERCGDVTTVRLSKKNFCHIRYDMEEFVDNAIFISGTLGFNFHFFLWYLAVWERTFSTFIGDSFTKYILQLQLLNLKIFQHAYLVAHTMQLW